MLTRNILIFTLFIGFIITGFGFVTAVPFLSISTSKSEYQYGDLLSFTISISEVTDKPLTLHIRDESGISSTPIILMITDKTTTITAKEPFDSTIYKPGRYYLDAEYSGVKTSTEFKIIGSDKIVIPSWIKDLAKWWSEGQIADKDFASGIQFMIKEEIIKIPVTQSSQANQNVKIPEWVRNNAGWWSDDLISDSDFALGIQHLIRIGIITV